jgi:hypothetical protein
MALIGLLSHLLALPLSPTLTLLLTVIPLPHQLRPPCHQVRACLPLPSKYYN